jgi:hypothetical protein
MGEGRNEAQKTSSGDEFWDRGALQGQNSLGKVRSRVRLSTATWASPAPVLRNDGRSKNMRRGMVAR